MKNGKHLLTCDICGKRGARIHKLPRSYGKGKQLLVIEQVPVVVCPNCGESYMTPDVVDEIDRIKNHPVSSTTRRPVLVASFD